MFLLVTVSIFTFVQIQFFWRKF